MTTCRNRNHPRTRTRTPGRSPAPAALLMAAVLLCISAARPPEAAAQIYKWVDDTGTEHYSTTPPPNANILTPKPAANQSPEPAGQSQDTPSPPQPVRNNAWDGSVKQVKDYLRHVLHDPDSIKYQDWSPVTAVDTPTHAYMVRCRYRAKNAYGAYVQENQIFYLDDSGAVVNVMDWK